MFQIDRAVAQVNDKVVALSGVDIEVSSALADFQLCVLPTGIVQRKPRELDAGVRRETDRAAIFEFDLYTSVVLCRDASALQNRQIFQRRLEAFSGPPVTLHVSLDVTQAHDPGLGIGKRRGSEYDDRESSQQTCKPTTDSNVGHSRRLR